MLNGSKDILFLVLSISSGVLTVLFAVLLIYLIGTLRNASFILREIRKKYSLLEKVFVGIKEKLDHSSTYLGLLAELVKKAVFYFIEGKVEVRRRGKKK